MRTHPAALLLLAGCAGASRPAAPMAPPTSADGTDPHAEIAKLEHDIVARGGTFTPQVSIQTDMVTMAELPKSTDASCHPAASETCSDSCKVSDAICDDAKQICDIAGKLAGDAWAAGKCESGKQSCTDANKKCCSCS